MRLAAALLVLAGTAHSTSYRAAVVEFAPQLAPSNSLSAADAAGVRMANVRAMEPYVKTAAANGTQIIVFPEAGIIGDCTGASDDVSQRAPWTRAGIAKMGEPAPAPGGAAPCDAAAAAASPATAALSCMAREHSIVLVANILDTQPCATCAGGMGLYNTAVAFDEGGRMIAKYHKHNLYPTEQPFIDPGPLTNGTRFMTSFGVEFGMFTCFDLLYVDPDPALKHFAFDTDWVNEAPLEKAATAQRLWAARRGASMLASNYGANGKKSSGSAIWSGGKALAGPFFNPTLQPQSQMLIADVPL